MSRDISGVRQMRHEQPHPTLDLLYKRRAAARRGDTTATAGRFTGGSVLRAMDMNGAAARRVALFQLELEIHRVERELGRRPYRFKRCMTCLKLHEVHLTTCDSNGRMLFELYAAISPDLVFVVE